MPYLILFLLLALFHVWFRRIIVHTVSGEFREGENLRLELDSLVKKETELRGANCALAQKAEAVIKLYEITKEVCKSLEENVVFNIFGERLRQSIKVDSLLLIKENLDYEKYKNELIFPLDIGLKPTFFLVAQGVPKEDQEEFYILAQQFLLGFRRAVLYQKIQDLAIHDGLTGVLTRRYFMERFTEEIKRAEKFNFSFFMLMLDIDHFKECNDKYGHLVCDAVLREVAQIVKDNIRQIDIAGRYGGEEFAVILSETSRQGALVAAGRILESVSAKKIRAYDEELSLTVSIGVAGFPEDGKPIKELIEKADAALYRAKENGRNQICFYSVIS